MITPVLVGSYWGNIRYLLLQDLVKMLISTMENGYKIIIKKVLLQFKDFQGISNSNQYKTCQEELLAASILKVQVTDIWASDYFLNSDEISCSHAKHNILSITFCFVF